MDRTERVYNPPEVVRLALESNQRTIWTALPGIIVKFPGTAGPANAWTVDVQPTINGLVQDQLGNRTWQKMPVLQDCPLLFQGGGKVTATFPIHAATVSGGVAQNDGDECLIIISSRCIDLWWQQGGIQNQAELRMHDLSDGFALPGVRSLPRVFALDTVNACLISDDQSTFIKLNPTSQTITATAPGGLNLNGVTIDSSGNLRSPATITGNTDVVTGAGISLTHHTHTDPQGGTVGPATG